MMPPTAVTETMVGRMPSGKWIVAGCSGRRIRKAAGPPLRRAQLAPRQSWTHRAARRRCTPPRTPVAPDPRSRCGTRPRSRRRRRPNSRRTPTGIVAASQVSTGKRGSVGSARGYATSPDACHVTPRKNGSGCSGRVLTGHISGRTRPLQARGSSVVACRGGSGRTGPGRRDQATMPQGPRRRAGRAIRARAGPQPTRSQFSCARSRRFISSPPPYPPMPPPVATTRWHGRTMGSGLAPLA